MKQVLNTFPISPLSGSPLAVKARLAADVQFQASTGEVVPSGDAQHNYVEYTLSALGNGRVFPTANDIDSTTDSSDPNATYTMYLINSLGREIGTLFERWMFDASLGPSILYSELESRNLHKVPLRDDQVYTKMQVDNLLLGRTFASPATVADLGTVKISGPSTTVVSTDDRRVESSYNVRATTIGAIGDGTTNDRAALNTLVNTTLQITGAGGDVYFPPGTYSIGSGMTFPANVRLRFDPRAMLKPANGVTVIDLTDHSGWDTAQKFTNALSGQGTISFSGNKTLGKVYPQWWGAVNDGATDAILPLNAASAAVDSAGSGTIILTFGSGFLITTGWTINPSAGIKAINVVAESATSGGIIWGGATNTWAVKFNRNKFARMSQVRISNSVAAGTTVGLFLTGPASGEQSANDDLNNVLITGFHVGVDLGDGTAAAAQIPLNSCYLDGNDIGLRVQNFNSVNINLFNTSILNCSQYGVQAAIYNLNVFGGSFANNTLGDFNLTPNMGTYLLAGIRTELNTAGSFVVGGNIINLTVQSLLIQSLTVSSAPLILADGVITLRGSTIHPGAPSTAMTIYQSQGNAALGQFICEQNEINSGATLFDPANGNNSGLHYHLMNNQKWADGGATSGRFADEPWGVVVGTAKSSFLGVGAGFASTPGTADQITASQNNYVLLNTRLIRLNTNASRNITGLTTLPTQVNGQEHIITNIGTQDIVLVNQSASSTAANRLLNATGADITLTANQQAFVWYDGSTARWRCSKLN